MRVSFDVWKRLGDFLLQVRGALEEGLTCVVGPNGSGKTTLMKILAGLLRPDGGSVSYQGVSSRAYLGDIYVPPDAKAIDVVLAGRTRHGRRPVGPGDLEAARRYAELMGLGGLLDRPWRTLSGGQRQRALLAAALATEADLLLIDEGLEHLHGDARLEAMRRLEEAARGRIVAISTHHLEAVRCCHTALHMREGRIAYLGPPEGLRLEPPTC